MKEGYNIINSFIEKQFDALKKDVNDRLDKYNEIIDMHNKQIDSLRKNQEILTIQIKTATSTITKIITLGGIMITFINFIVGVFNKL